MARETGKEKMEEREKVRTRGSSRWCFPALRHRLTSAPYTMECCLIRSSQAGAATRFAGFSFLHNMFVSDSSSGAASKRIQFVRESFFLVGIRRMFLKIFLRRSILPFGQSRPLHQPHHPQSRPCRMRRSSLFLSHSLSVCLSLPLPPPFIEYSPSTLQASFW